MKKLIPLILITLLYTNNFSYCQSNIVEISPLNIGDTIPGIIWNMPLQMINNPQGKEIITLKDYRGKLIILDFWATNCSSCIKAIPKMDMVQQKFKDSIVILPVTYEKRKNASMAFEKNKILKQSTLGSIVEDSLLKAIFPHQYISHLVWIDTHGTIRAFTHTDYVSQENIKLLLKDKSINWPVKREFAGFDYRQNLFVPNSKNLPATSIPKLQYHSAITGNLASIGTRNSEYIDTINKTYNLHMINYPIWKLYVKAMLDNGKDVPVSNVIVKTNKAERYFFNPKTTYEEEWDLRNTFCYEAVFPLSASTEQRKDKLKFDLDFFFNLKSSFEDVKVKCLVISDTKDNGNTQKNNNKGDGLDIGSIVYILNNSLLSTPVVNETKKGKTAIIKINEDDIGNISLLRNELRKQGFDLNEQERIYPMLILKELDKKSESNE